MNDSLYGAAHVELDRQGPVVITVPADPDGRYYSVAILDGHWTNVAHLGPKWTGRGEVRALLVPPGWEGEAPDGRDVVECPTASACLLNRVLVGYDDGDLDRVRAWRTGFTLRPLHGELTDVPHADLVHGDLATLYDPWRYVELGLDHLLRNPWPREVAWVDELVDVAGLVAAADEEWSRQAVVEGVADAQAIVDATLTAWPRRDGWRLSFPWIGLPTSHLAQNAALQLFQVGSNDLGEAAYYFADYDEQGEALDGSGGAVFEVVFEPGAQPPVDDAGFWSLTMYGPDNLLVENPLHRYSTRATRPGFRTGDDGSVTVVVSAALPDGVHEANWLPAPVGPFRLGMRLYYPTATVVTGEWTPPPVRRA